MEKPNWEWYRSFLLVYQKGSLSAAARASGVSQPTVGRHIDNLEAALRLKLFTRSVDGFAPTEAAHELQPYASNLAATAAALRRVASSQGAGVRGTVRLTVADVIGIEVLPPILAALREQHPELKIELVLSDKADDLLHREADIAVRMFRPVQEALIATRVGAIELGLHAHKRYLRAHGTPKSLADLARHSTIGFDREHPVLRTMPPQLKRLSRDDVTFRTDSNLAQLAAIRAGIGIGVCQNALARRDKHLVRVLEKEFSMTLDTWVAMHEDLRTSARCMATFTALVAGMQAYVAGEGG